MLIMKWTDNITNEDILKTAWENSHNEKRDQLLGHVIRNKGLLRNVQGWQRIERDGKIKPVPALIT